MLNMYQLLLYLLSSHTVPLQITKPESRRVKRFLKGHIISNRSWIRLRISELPSQSFKYIILRNTEKEKYNLYKYKVP